MDKFVKRQSSATASDGKVDVPNKKAKWKQEYNEKRKEGPSKELIRKWLSKYGWLRVDYGDGSGGATFYCQMLTHAN